MARIFYFTLQDEQTKHEKLDWFANIKIEKIPFEQIIPDKKANWVNQTDNDFDNLLPLVNKEVKAGRSEEAVFKLFSYGFDTKRDEWIYDFNQENLKQKVFFFSNAYNESIFIDNPASQSQIKWSRNLKRDAERGLNLNLSDSDIISSNYRPFTSKFLYWNKMLISETFQWFNIPINSNYFLAFSGIASNKPFQSWISDVPLCGDFLEKTQCLPLYRYDDKGDRIDNITDWGLTQFQTHYQDSKITKLDIFHYTYAVLHHPAYRTKYELNLKREFPRLPFYQDFHQWTNWGKTLMELHLNYETIQPYGLQQVEIATKENPKVKLKADKINGVITLDENTQLIGVNAIAWEYKLGNRSALEWILDQYKEKKPKDPTIAKLFNTYKFADYKEQVIDLLQRVCTVSIKTMEIIQQMP